MRTCRGSFSLPPEAGGDRASVSEPCLVADMTACMHARMQPVNTIVLILFDYRDSGALFHSRTPPADKVSSSQQEQTTSSLSCIYPQTSITLNPDQAVRTYADPRTSGVDVTGGSRSPRGPAGISQPQSHPECPPPTAAKSLLNGREGRTSAIRSTPPSLKGGQPHPHQIKPRCRRGVSRRSDRGCAPWSG